jgi:hypothetical protein
MAESSHCFQTCNRNSIHCYSGLYPLKGADEVSGEVVIEKSLSYMLLFMVPEQVSDSHSCSYCK